MIAKRLAHVFQTGGILAVLRAVVRRLRTPRARSFVRCRNAVQGRHGLEIGGPSPIFARGGLLPLYPHCGQLDNVTFSHQTIWEGTVHEGQSFVFDSTKRAGRQFVTEGARLTGITPASYDFVLSSHMIEHTANPLGALCEWARVLRPEGTLLIVVPHREGTFDHRRPVTLLSHLIDDFEAGRTEADETHVQEVLLLHDIDRDPGVANLAAFHERIARNAEFRSLHHHVFDTRLVVEAVRYAGFREVAVEPLLPYHIAVLACKAPPGTNPAQPSEVLAAALARSPFPTDRQRDGVHAGGLGG